MARKGIIGIAIIAIIAIIVIIVIFSAFILDFFDQPPLDIVEEEPLHSGHLKDFLAGTGLIFVPVVRNDFAYYELHTADEQLAGFIFLGVEEGWGGPINLFVKTDRAGVIQRVHVWQHTETPIYVVGLDAFLVTFAGNKAEEELIWQEDVHGITGATITAEAIIAAIQEPGQAAYQMGIFTRKER